MKQTKQYLKTILALAFLFTVSCAPPSSPTSPAYAAIDDFVSAMEHSKTKEDVQAALDKVGDEIRTLKPELDQLSESEAGKLKAHAKAAITNTTARAGELGIEPTEFRSMAEAAGLPK